MSSVSSFQDIGALAQDSAAWRLMRATNAPFVIAVLNEHLGGTQRRLPVAELVSLVEADIEELRFRTGMEFTRSAQAYCEQWRVDGYLIRRPVARTRQETYELSPDAAAVIRFVTSLLKPRRSATQSRLDTIVSRISKLALETDENLEHRRAALMEERARIDEQLAQLETGSLDPIDADRALEQVEDIISLAQEIPEDFLHVRADFERISQRLHASIVNGDDESEDILEDVFAGVDRIGQSPSGRSFKGFYQLLSDQELTDGVQDAIDAILDRDFANDLPADERRFLRSLLRDFRVQSQETQAVLTGFAYALQRFVQSQSYQQDRLLKQQLDRTLGMVHDVFAAQPVTRKADVPFARTAIGIRPISRLKLRHPADSRTEPLELAETEAAPVMTYEQLREAMRESEIDFAELTANVNRVIAGQRRGAPSVGEVLDAFPATQGVASVVGLLSLAMEQGRARPDAEPETVRWITKEGRPRRARVQTLEFYQEVS